MVRLNILNILERKPLLQIGTLFLKQKAYLILFHHDECPLENDFIDIIDKLFLENEKLDLLVLRSLKLIKNTNYLREHYPIWLKKLFIHIQPEYILKKFLGPTASIVYKKELLIKYDPNLVWFIDIDMYFRLFQKSNSTLFTDKASVFSKEYQKSITNQIKIKLNEIQKKEKYLDQKYSPIIFGGEKKYFGKYLDFIDKTIWIIIKLFIKLFSRKYKK